MNSFQKELEEIHHFLNDYELSNTELVKELKALIQSADDVVLLVYSRRALEVIITEMCEEIMQRDRGSEPLKGLIDRLAKDKLIPSYIHTSMSNLNSMSTYGAHPKEFNQRQVKTTIIELTTVLEWYINEHKKLVKKTAAVNAEIPVEKKETEKQEIVKEERAKEKEVKIQKEEIKKESSSASGSGKNKKVAVFTAIGTVIVAVVIGFIISNGKRSDKNTANEKQTDTAVVNLPKEVVAEELTKQTNTATETEKPAITTKPEIKPEISKIVLPENIEEAFNKIKEFPKDKRSQAAGELAKRFAEGSLIYLINLGEPDDAKSYVTGKLVLKNYKYKNAEIVEKNSKGLIVRLKIEEVVQ